jgi:hypothetical protein
MAPIDPKGFARSDYRADDIDELSRPVSYGRTKQLNHMMEMQMSILIVTR